MARKPYAREARLWSEKIENVDELVQGPLDFDAWVEWLKKEVQEGFGDDDPVVIIGLDPKETWDLLMANLPRIIAEKGYPMHMLLPDLEYQIKDERRNFIAFSYRAPYMFVIGYQVEIRPIDSLMA